MPQDKDNSSRIEENGESLLNCEIKEADDVVELLARKLCTADRNNPDLMVSDQPCYIASGSARDCYFFPPQRRFFPLWERYAGTAYEALRWAQCIVRGEPEKIDSCYAIKDGEGLRELNGLAAEFEKSFTVVEGAADAAAYPGGFYEDIWSGHVGEVPALKPAPLYVTPEDAIAAWLRSAQSYAAGRSSWLFWRTRPELLECFRNGHVCGYRIFSRFLIPEAGKFIPAT